MKEIYKYETALGNSGAKAAGVFGVEGDHFQLAVNVNYPVAKLIEPATKALDSLLDKLADIIPGQWDKPILDKVKAEYKELLIKIISEENVFVPSEKMVEESAPAEVEVVEAPKV